MALILSGDTGPSFVQSAALPVGSVLQVVSANYGVETSTTSSTFIDTGMSATITPKYATSKILVLCDMAGVYKTSSDTGVNIKLLRNSTDLITFAKASAYTASSGTSMVGTQSCNYLDSPATTSAVTYKTQFMSTSNSSLARVMDNAQVSTMTLIEIAV